MKAVSACQHGHRIWPRIVITYRCVVLTILVEPSKAYRTLHVKRCPANNDARITVCLPFAQ